MLRASHRRPVELVPRAPGGMPRRRASPDDGGLVMTRPKRDATVKGAWSPSEGRVIMDMRVRNESDEAIAAVLHRTPAAIQSRASKLRRSGVALVPELRFWSPSETDRVVAMREAGATVAAIARVVGRSEHAVRDRVRAMQDDGTLNGAPGGVDRDHVAASRRTIRCWPRSTRNTGGRHEDLVRRRRRHRRRPRPSGIHRPDHRGPTRSFGRRGRGALREASGRGRLRGVRRCPVPRCRAGGRRGPGRREDRADDPAVRDAVLMAVRAITAHDDDMSTEVNGVGWSHATSRPGHVLAREEVLDTGRAFVAMKLLRKHRK